MVEPGLEPRMSGPSASVQEFTLPLTNIIPLMFYISLKLWIPSALIPALLPRVRTQGLPYFLASNRYFSSFNKWLAMLLIGWELICYVYKKNIEEKPWSWFLFKLEKHKPEKSGPCLNIMGMYYQLISSETI